MDTRTTFASARNVLCIYPWGKGVSPTNWLPPLGLEYISAAVKKTGAHTHLVDMRFEPDPEPLRRLQAEAVCISANWEDQVPLLPLLTGLFKPDQSIIVGGRAATFSAEEIFRTCPQVDFIVRGDGEETISELFAGRELGTIAGLSCRANGSVRHNPNRRFAGFPEDIQPDREGRKQPYRIRMGTVETGIAVDMLSSSRGCPFHCKFCTFSRAPLGEKRPWTGRSAQSVVAELEGLEAEYVLFTDDHFAADIGRVEKLCDLIIERSIKKTIGVALRIEVAFHDAVLAKLWKAGFKFLSLGIESTSDTTLREFEKGFDTARAREAYRRLRKYPFLLAGYFIVGNLGETEADMLRVADFASELGLDFIYPSYLKMEQASPLEEMVAKSGGAYYVDSKGYVCSREYSRDRLKSIRKRIHRRFYSVPHVLSVLRKVFRHRMMGWRNAVKMVRCSLQHTGNRRKLLQEQRRIKASAAAPPEKEVSRVR
jgi:radical SAM superfamily enzyme YgiQ (UPF0313 family)